jgi:hypothetical protein
MENIPGLVFSLRMRKTPIGMANIKKNSKMVMEIKENTKDSKSV